MMMEEFECWNLIKQLNDEHGLILDDIMHRIKYTLIH
jgi:hypothetical protein